MFHHLLVHGPNMLLVIIRKILINEDPELLLKGNRTIADLRFGGKDIISLSTLIFAPIKG